MSKHDLAYSCSNQVLVRAVNDHGLSPPSPVSKPMKTTTKISADQKDDIFAGKAAEKNPALVRLRLSQRIIELQEASAVTSKKVKLQWEVSLINTVSLFFITIDPPKLVGKGLDTNKD